MNEYSNRDNELVTTKDGRKIWDSRSCAVTSVVIVRVGRWYQKKKYFLLTTVRGKNTPDFQGFKCCPCGYLDWDETLHWAAVRETEEETTIDLPYIWNNKSYYVDPADKKKQNKVKILYDRYTEGQPFYLSSEPSANRQNITACFGIVLAIAKEEQLPLISGVNVNKPEYEEVASADWIPLEEISKHKFAFNHAHRAADFYSRYIKETTNLRRRF
ncbi:MAG: NUDIX hydrolase [bacterium]|nr:NUDIX hydrolase [bacterium]